MTRKHGSVPRTWSRLGQGKAAPWCHKDEQGSVAHSGNLGNRNQPHFFLHMYTVVFRQILTCLSSNTVPSVQIYLQCQPANDPRTKQKRGFCYTPVACIAYVMNSVSKHQKPADKTGDAFSSVHSTGKQEEGMSG